MLLVARTKCSQTAQQLLTQALRGAGSSACCSSVSSPAGLDATACSSSSRQFSSGKASSRKADVVVVGAGHNGLVSALLLAKQGLKVG